MIPLSHWLTERSGVARALASDPAPEESQQTGETLQFDTPPACVADRQSREEELLAAVQRAEERIEELSVAYAEKERELLSRLGDDLSSRIATEMSRALDDVLGILEECLGEVLTPFLCDKARARATSRLLDLVREELRQTDDPVLEIRAPAELHDSLSLLREAADVSSTLTESGTVEIVRSAHRMRFEELSLRWCQVIEGGAS